MTEGFWKWLADKANKELTKRELKKRTAGLINRVDCLSGQIAIGFDDIKVLINSTIDQQISDYWRSNGPTLVQQFVDQLKLGPKLSDHIVVQKEMHDENRELVQKDLQRGFTLNASLLGRILGNQSVQATKAEKRQNHLMEAFNELARQAAIHDQSNTDRNLTLVNMLQLLNDKIEHKLDLLQGMQVKFFENLTLQIQMATSKDKERFTPAPKLEWLFDNIDHIFDFADAMKLAKSNDAPRSSQIMKAISAVRSMELFSVSNVRKEIERWLNIQDNDQTACAA